jgi:hypothetical protein
MSGERAHAARRLYLDLRAAGVAAAPAARAEEAYVRALHVRQDTAWTQLYDLIFASLDDAARRRSLAGAPRAVGSLLRLLDDDLGSRRFSAPERERIRRSLLEDAGKRETSLSS